MGREIGLKSDRAIIEGYPRVPREESRWDEIAGRDSVAEEPL